MLGVGHQYILKAAFCIWGNAMDLPDLASIDC